MLTHTLNLAPDLFEPIRQGQKLSTIRQGYKSVGLGPLDLVTPPGTESPQTLRVLVTEVTHKTLRYVTRMEHVFDGHETRLEMLEALRRHYPRLQMDDEITLVVFHLPD